MENISETLIIGYDMACGDSLTELSVVKQVGSKLEHLNVFYGEEAEDIYKKLTVDYKKGISLSRLCELITAVNENRLLILPTRRDEIVKNINNALNISLQDWQIAYIFNESNYMMPGRQTGKTTAYILKILLSEGDPIHLYQPKMLQQYCDACSGPRYQLWFRNRLRDIYEDLSQPGLAIKLRKVYFHKADIW